MDYYNLLPGVTAGDVRKLLESANEQSFKYSGAGSFYGTYQTVLSKIDRFGYNIALPNTEKAGLTFITRPQLNLTTASIRQDPIMATLDTVNQTTLPFTIRCLLDSRFAQRHDIIDKASSAPFLNNELPFIVPLTNSLESISGWPDFVLDTETTEGGFFSESQTFAKGSDFLNRNYDLTLTFRDIQGGFIMSTLLYWMYWIALAARGTVTPYPDDIAARRYCYTCSIYRFVLDPSLKYITKWAKATGCFPKALPIGNSFNIGERESFLSSNIRFSIPFQVNHVEYMDPRIFGDFNLVMSKFAGRRYWENSSLQVADNVPEHNYTGLPYIATTEGFNELKFLCRPEELQDPVEDQLAEIRRRVEQYQRDRTRESLPTLNTDTDQQTVSV